jgi:methylase of polypeptide subunit release factors
MSRLYPDCAKPSPDCQDLSMTARRMTFGPLVVTFDEAVLQPRPWTLLQAAWLDELDREGALPPGPILELCCGAGHIGQAAAAFTGRALVQVDLDPHACALARANAEANGLGAVVEVRNRDLGAAVDLAGGERFPVVLADPPYLPADEVESWPDDPALAIDGGDGEGLALPRRCVTVAAGALADGGVVLLQARGADQVEALGPDIEAAGLVLDGLREEDEERAVALLRAAAQSRP